MDDLIFKDEFYKIKEACIEVRKELGNGFLEKVYENSLKIELESKGFTVESQKKLIVRFKGDIVGEYLADLVIDDKIIIELKTCAKLTNIHKAQLLNYLKATGYRLGILVNFPPSEMGFEIERMPNFLA
ncbi:MAG: GxxExxY protein [Candidatus Cloacimonadota bacterium]|nr:MAG: GxxExxY protein [Candidatus Cloacimonadota bacterium]RLC51987.1 MAG: GxxExxY protein [Candidatus Cloacimonadota bacterium]